MGFALRGRGTAAENSYPWQAVTWKSQKSYSPDSRLSASDLHFGDRLSAGVSDMCLLSECLRAPCSRTPGMLSRHSRRCSPCAMKLSHGRLRRISDATSAVWWVEGSKSLQVLPYNGMCKYSASTEAAGSGQGQGGSLRGKKWGVELGSPGLLVQLNGWPKLSRCIPSCPKGPKYAATESLWFGF